MGLTAVIAAGIGIFSNLGEGAAFDSLAVLPMQNLSPDSTQEYFSDGLTAELITHLYAVRELKVRSWQTVMAYKDTRKSPMEIGRELGVNAILGSTFVRSGKRIRLAFQLTEANTDRGLWGHTYETDGGEILDVLAEVSQSVVREVRVSFTPQEQGVLARSRKVDPHAYDLYLKARAQSPGVVLLSEDQWRTSLRYAQEAALLDPTYAGFHVGVAKVYLQGAGVGYVMIDELVREGERAVEQALHLDSASAEAWFAHGLIQTHKWQWEASIKATARALELSPGNAIGRLTYGYTLIGLNRRDEGIAEAKKAVELDPAIDPDGQILGAAFFMARRFDEALELGLAGVKRNPNDASLHCFLAQFYAVKGLKQDALREVELSFTLGIPEENVVLMLNNAITYALCGQQQKALSALHRYQSTRSSGDADPYWVGAVYAALDMRTEAFMWLDRAFQSRSLFMAYLIDVPWDNLRTDPRFREILKKTGLDVYW